MALPGSQVDWRSRIEGVRGLRAWATDLRGAVEERAPLLPDEEPRLVTSNRSDLFEAVEVMAESPLVWTDDRYCFQRATHSAHAINRALRAGIDGFSDELAACVAVQPWGNGFHACAAMSSPAGLLFYDALLNDRPVHYAEWKAAIPSILGDRVETRPVRLYSPLQERRQTLTPELVDWAHNALASTWRKSVGEVLVHPAWRERPES